MADRKEQLKEITDKLEQGIKDVFESGKYADYLQAMSKFHRYSINNCLLIAMQCPAATMVAGYRKWQDEFGRQVKKGETAIRILAPMTRKRKTVVQDEDGNEREEEVKYTTYRAVPVFDISQTEGKELPNICRRLDGDDGAELIDRVIAAAPVPVQYKDIEGSANGYYSRTEGLIAVRKDLSPMQTLKTLIHEVAHATLHCEDGVQADANRGAKEVQAESVAYTVCNYFGIDTSEYSFGYVAAWSEGKELAELRESLEVIRTTAGAIIDSIAA